jgi:hypothetical protein
MHAMERVAEISGDRDGANRPNFLQCAPPHTEASVTLQPTLRLPFHPYQRTIQQRLELQPLLRLYTDRSPDKITCTTSDRQADRNSD